MLALRLPAEMEKRLDALARRTGRTKSFYARQAIIEKIEDLEDYYLALERSSNPQRASLPLRARSKRKKLSEITASQEMNDSVSASK